MGWVLQKVDFRRRRRQVCDLGVRVRDWWGNVDIVGSDNRVIDLDCRRDCAAVSKGVIPKP